MAPIARKLLADVTAVQGLVKTVDLDPATIANGVVGLLNDASASKVIGAEDIYAHTDLDDVDANVVGAQAAYNAIRPLVVPRSLALAGTIDQGFGAILAALQPFQKGAGYVASTTLSSAERQDLVSLIDGLTDPLSQVAAIVVTAQ